jgi:hypothetical protein
MEALLEKGADPNLDTGEFCAFTYAANLGCIGQLNILLHYHKLILDQLDSEGRSLLTHAVISGNIECIRAVLNLKPVFDQTVNKIQEAVLKLTFDEAMMVAPILSLLLEGGFPIDAPLDSGQSFIATVLSRQKFYIADALIEAAAREFVIDAVLKEYPDHTIRALLGHGGLRGVKDLGQPEGKPLIHHTARQASPGPGRVLRELPCQGRSRAGCGDSPGCRRDEQHVPARGRLRRERRGHARGPRKLQDPGHRD